MLTTKEKVPPREHPNSSPLESQLLLPKESSRGRSRKCYIPARIVLAICSFTGFVNVFTLRTDLNLALLDMVRESNNKNITHDQSEHSAQADSKFDWSNDQQNYLLAAFFYGYFATQILGGYLSGRFGGKRILGYSLLIASVIALISPISARTDYVYLLLCRICQGLAQGLGQPCMHNMWARWAPTNEKSKLLTFTYAGCQLGTVIATLATSYMCVYSGWPLVFYVFGGAGVLWFVAWHFLIYDKPSEHPRISEGELSYIEENVTLPPNWTEKRIPWLRIFTSPRFLAIVSAHFATDWGTFALTNYIPTFLDRSLHLDITQNGFLSSLPYILVMIINPLSGFIADSLRSRRILSTKNTRKLMNSLGLFIPSGLMIGVCQSDSSETLTIALITLAIGFTGFTMAGYSVNHLDIAPPFAGLLFGLSNTVGTTTGFIGPLVMNKVVKDQKNLGEWQVFFYITAGVFFVGGLIFALFAGGEPEPWAFEEYEEVRYPKGSGNIQDAQHEHVTDSVASTSSHPWDIQSSRSNHNTSEAYDDVDWENLWTTPCDKADCPHSGSFSSFYQYGSLY